MAKVSLFLPRPVGSRRPRRGKRRQTGLAAADTGRAELVEAAGVDLDLRGENHRNESSCAKR